jgi:nicotinate phosphoribosyltransferase
MSMALLTDLYELTMAEGYWRLGMAEREACFHLSFRTLPFGGHFAVAAGLESVIEWCNQFHFSDDDVSYLATLPSPTGKPLFSAPFLDYLSSLCFTCDVDAVVEGRLVFPKEPLVRVRGPLLQAQFLETILLNLINFPTLIATKAARVRLAAQNDQLFEFGARRAQGVNGAVTASRAAYIGGCDATSNLVAGQKFGIPVAGTHAHSWVMAFDGELEAFEAYAQTMPHNAVFLVDTYHTRDGVGNAIRVAREMVEAGEKPLGIRLDSGDLCQLAKEARRQLDDAGLHEMKIVASNELDEERIAALKADGAPIDMWGVGTRLATGHPDGALDGVYKLAAIRDEQGGWHYRSKSSDSKIKGSLPGILGVRRYVGVKDVIYDLERPEEGGEELLTPIFRNGKRLYTPPTAAESREVAMEELAGWNHMAPYPVEVKL